MSKPETYRIEQRVRADGTESTVGLFACMPVTGRPLTRESGTALLCQRAAQRPDLYGPHGDMRLVLVPADSPIGRTQAITPESLGVSDDRIAQALHLLGQLTAVELATVLAYYPRPS